LLSLLPIRTSKSRKIYGFDENGNLLQVLQPLLLLYSRDDPLAPAERIDQFVEDVRKAGADVTAATWPQSLHVGTTIHCSYSLSEKRASVLLLSSQLLSDSGSIMKLSCFAEVETGLKAAIVLFTVVALS
jgi:acetyl esterase/lipase